MANDKIKVDANNPEKSGYCYEKDLLSGKTMLKKIGAGIEDITAPSVGELA